MSSKDASPTGSSGSSDAHGPAPRQWRTQERKLEIVTDNEKMPGHRNKLAIQSFSSGADKGSG